MARTYSNFRNWVVIIVGTPIILFVFYHFFLYLYNTYDHWTMKRPNLPMKSIGYSDSYKKIKFDKTFGYFDNDGNYHFNKTYSYARGFLSENYTVIGTLVNGKPKYGFIDNKGNIVIKPQFDEAHASLFEGDYARVKKNNTEYYLNIKTGKLISGGEFDKIPYFAEGFARIQINNKWGFIDTNKKLVIPAKFEEVSNFNEGIVKVKENGKWGFIDKSGNYIIKPKFNDISDFREGYAAVSLGYNKNGIIDKKGNYLVEPIYESVGMFSDGLANIENYGDNKISYTDRSGKIINIQVDYGEDFHNDMALVHYQYEYDHKSDTEDYLDHRLYGYIKKDGTFLLKPQFKLADSFSEGFAVVKNDGSYSMYIDTKGNYLTNKDFYYASSFDEGYACVKDNYKYGYIDKTGNYFIKPQFDDAKSFNYGYAVVSKNGVYGYIRILK